MARTKQAAGLLMFRQRDGYELEVLLAHPGGPIWANKDQGAWTIPKGEYLDDEAPLAAAQREFLEETGFSSAGPFTELSTIKQKSGKVVSAWAFAGDCDPAQMRSNTFQLEWPKGSGRMQECPEVDRVAWFTVAEARARINPAQAPFLDLLCDRIGIDSAGVQGINARR